MRRSTLMNYNASVRTTPLIRHHLLTPTLLYALTVLPTGLVYAATKTAADALTSSGQIIPAQIHELTDSFEWGYQSGLKQPLGRFKGGLSIHQITKSNYPKGKLGNPDYILWVNEETNKFGIETRPGGYEGETRNPGGMVGFDEEDRIWYTIGGRAQHFPLRLYRSRSAFKFDFDRVINHYADCWQCTVPTLQVIDPSIVLIWREGHSARPGTTARLRRYDMDNLDTPEMQIDVGAGSIDRTLGAVGIEQLWTRYDPRFGYLMLTWQWYDIKKHNFGSNPFLYSEDKGNSWHTADGRLVDKLPVTYNDVTPALVPFDDLRLGEHHAWQPRDIGVAPDKTFWITLPKGDAKKDNGWSLVHWYYNGKKWESNVLTGGMPARSKPHATGSTTDYLFFVYSEYKDNNILKAKISSDGGKTWSPPQIIDQLPESMRISWASFVQPTDSCPDNKARFFYGYYRAADGADGRKYQNKIRWIMVDGEDIEKAANK